jgi:imidazolonepropionase-like amidohydrolase
MILTADWLVDGTGGAALPKPRVEIADGRILSVTRQGDPREPVDHAFPGCTLLPGLIDTHVHLTFAALETHAQVVQQVSAETEQTLFARAIGNAQAALKCGVTTLRDCGGRGLVTLAVRDAIRQGLVQGPEVLVSGMPITTTNGHLHYLGLIADTEPEVRAAANRMVEAGVDFLKLIATGGNMTPSSNRLACQYDLASVRAVVELGQKAGLHTSAHVLAKCALPQCVETGVRTIEHCMWRVTDDRYDFDPELAHRLANQEQYAGFTFTAPTWRKVRPDVAKIDAALLGDLDVRFENERRTIDAGVKYTIHTDAGVRQTPFGLSLALAVQAAVLELRLTPLEAIRAVTGTAAEAIGLADRGVLAPGKRADLLMVEGNAAQDLAALGRVRGVMQRGAWHDGR